MKHTIWMSLAVLAGVCAVNEAARGKDGGGGDGSERQSERPIKVFLLAGQSNMEGQGVVSMDHPKYYNGGKGNLAWSLKHGKSAAAMKHLVDDKGKWVVRDDVKVWFKIKRGVTKGPLRVGYTGYGGTSHIGPELQFGHVVGDFFDEPVLLIKTAWGGKSLYKDFRPPSSPGAVGPYYRQMLAEIREALADIKTLFPQRKSHKYEIAGFVWFQGWNDMCTKPAIPEYPQNLVNLVADIRKEYKLPRLPVVIGELGNGGPKASGNMAAFRKAQRDGAGRIDGAVFVETHDFARPAKLSPNVGHGHHWFGNAESYFLVGDALGKAMVKLLPARTAGQVLYQSRQAYTWFDRRDLAGSVAARGAAAVGDLARRWPPNTGTSAIAR